MPPADRTAARCVAHGATARPDRALRSGSPRGSGAPCPCRGAGSRSPLRSLLAGGAGISGRTLRSLRTGGAGASGRTLRSLWSGGAGSACSAWRPLRSLWSCWAGPVALPVSPVSLAAPLDRPCPRRDLIACFVSFSVEVEWFLIREPGSVRPPRRRRRRAQRIKPARRYPSPAAAGDCPLRASSCTTSVDLVSCLRRPQCRCSLSVEKPNH